MTGGDEFVPGALLGDHAILHNNLATQRGDTNPLDLDVEDWHALIDANLTGMWLTSRNVVPVMRERRAGAIVNVSSTMSVFAVPCVLGYSW
ncbi:SDR family NAD(P)-dependent oxidoreductase [Streptomyces sp. NPDC001970]